MMIRTLLLGLFLSSFAYSKDVEREIKSDLAWCIDLRSGKVTRATTDTFRRSDDGSGMLFVEGPEMYILDPQANLDETEPIIVDGMFQGWREKGCCPILELISRPTKENPGIPIVIGNGEPGRTATVSLDTSNLAASSRDFSDFPRLVFDRAGEIRFKIRVKDSSAWIVHVMYRGQTLEITDNWSMLEDF